MLDSIGPRRVLTCTVCFDRECWLVIKGQIIYQKIQDGRAGVSRHRDNINDLAHNKGASTRRICICRTNAASRDVWCDYFWRHKKSFAIQKRRPDFFCLATCFFPRSQMQSEQNCGFAEISKFSRERCKRSRMGDSRNIQFPKENVLCLDACVFRSYEAQGRIRLSTFS